MKIIVGIIGGTGFDRETSLVKNRKLVDLEETPYGWASDSQAISGEIEGIPVFILSRHGKSHQLNASSVNYRANLWTLVKQLGCTHILATSTCFSLKEDVVPGHLATLDQYVDRTCSFRNRTFYKVCHVSQRSPINSTMQQFIEESSEEQGVMCHKRLTTVTVEGPRLTTYAESKELKKLGYDAVNMTSVPEVPLAAELATFYACIMLITDYDCWQDEVESIELTAQRMDELNARLNKILPGVIKRIGDFDWTRQHATNQADLAEAMMAE